jgi:hypothetical protein
VFYTVMLSPERTQPEADTLADADFRQHDPARREIIDWGTLGNIGSAARPLLYTPERRLGFQTGVDAFNLYKLKPEQLHFSKALRSFSDVFFSQGRNQNENLVRARFCRNFDKGAAFSLDYKTFNYLGQFVYQQAKHNALSIGLYVPFGKRYEAFLVLTNNIVRQQENGGIVTDTVFGSGQFQGPAAAAVWLGEKKAFTRQADQILQLSQYLRLLGNTEKRALRLGHSFRYETAQYKFTDAAPKADTLFLGDFVTDTRGVRVYFDVKRWENHVFLSTFRSKEQGKPSDWFQVGLRHAFVLLDQEPLALRRINNVFATADAGLRLSDRLLVRGDAALGLLRDIGEYQLQADLTLRLGPLGTLQGGIHSQRYSPTLMQNRLFVTGLPLWNNNFNKPVESSLWGTYSLPRLGFEGTAKTYVANNYIYFDQTGRPAQTATALPVLQIILKENLRVGPVHLDNTIALQQSNRLDEVLRLPGWFSKNSLYFSGKVFRKNMHLNAGVDFRVNAAFRPDAWQPVTWQWNLQDTVTQKPYPQLDIFVAFKVQNFRFFLRYDNFNTVFDKSKVFYQTAGHPLQFGALRLGIRWRFLDYNTAQPNQQPGGSGGGPPPGVGSGGPPRQ